MIPKLSEPYTTVSQYGLNKRGIGKIKFKYNMKIKLIDTKLNRTGFKHL